LPDGKKVKVQGWSETYKAYRNDSVMASVWSSAAELINMGGNWGDYFLHNRDMNIHTVLVLDFVMHKTT